MKMSDIWGWDAIPQNYGHYTKDQIANYPEGNYYGFLFITEEAAGGVAHAVRNHDNLVNLLDMFDRYQGNQDDYLDSPFCAEVRECLFANGACQDDERPKEKANEIHDKLTERVKELKESLSLIAEHNIRMREVYPESYMGRDGENLDAAIALLEKE